MKQKLQNLDRILYAGAFKIQFLISGLTLILILLINNLARAQNCNVNLPINATNFTNLSVASSTELCILGNWPCSRENLINNDGNPATLPFPLAGSNYLEVRVNSNDFAAGNFVGFDFAQVGLIDLGLFSNITISTYQGTTLQESKSGNNLAVGISIIGTSRKVVGFTSSLPFNRIRITTSGINISLGSLQVYSAIVKQFCEGITLPCNTSVQLSSPAYPFTIDDANSGVLGIGLGNSVNNLDRVLDANLNNFATILKPAISVGTKVSLSVKKALSPIPANTFGGFDIETVGLLNLSALNGMTVTLLNNGDTVQSTTGENLVAVGIPLLSGSGRRTIGTLATAPFNELRLTVNFGLADVALLTATNVYGPVVTQYCLGSALACNLPTQVKKPTHPIYVDGRHTGINGVGSVGTINNWERAIDDNDTSVARIIQTAGILSTASFTIGDALNTYPANTFAGFKISTTSLLNASVLNYYSIQLLNNGSVVQTSNAASVLLDVNSLLFNGAHVQTIGIVSNSSFDAVKLVIAKPVAIDLGIVDIHGLVLESLCNVALSCNQSSILQYGSHPVIINAMRTGVLGVANVGVSVTNAGNVLTAEDTDFAQITTVASILSNASISVQNPIQTYPAGTFAGFVVENSNGVLNAGLLSSIRISTYLDGNFQEQVSGINLLDLTLLITILGPSSDVRNIGFVTTQPFDEVRISVGEVIAVSSTLNVYGAFIDTRSAIGGGLFCKATFPDFAVTEVRKTVVGDVSINDIAPVGTTYGSPIADPNNPDGTLLTVASNGSYSFSPILPGKYQFDIPVCLPALTNGCATEKMTITVTQRYDQNSYPIINDDIVLTKGAAINPIPIVIKVKANDNPGNYGGGLGIPSIVNSGVGAPSHGTASVDGNGNIVYTPLADYYGEDQFSYTVCETPSGLCASAMVYLTILSPDVANSTYAGANFYTTLKNKMLTVNSSLGLLVNALDPEGNIQMVVPKTETIAGKGTLNLMADGSFTFNPVSDFTGPIIFDFYVNDNGTPIANSRGTVEILVRSFPLITYPDIAVTMINKNVSGSLAVNDVAPIGTTYSTVVALPGNPNNTLLTLNNDGTFSFTPTLEGQYQFDVSVCLPGQVSDCVTERISIFAILQTEVDNIPIINTDIGISRGNDVSPNPIAINVIANDAAGNMGGTLGPITVTNSGPGAPLHGVVSVNNNGEIIYTPNAGFYGDDYFTYTTCESPASTCASAIVKVSVQAMNAANTIVCSDDYISTTAGEVIAVSAINGVIANDLDLESASLTVVPMIETVPNKGTFTLNADGSYVFVPTAGFSGSLIFNYEILDNGMPTASANGSVHINVMQYPDLTPVIMLSDNTYSDNQVKDVLVYIEEVKGVATAPGQIALAINAPIGFSWLPFDENQTLVTLVGGGSYAVDNNSFDVIQSTSSQILLLAKSSFALPSNGVVLIGVQLQHTSASNGEATTTVNIFPDIRKRYDDNTANNVYYRVLLKQ